jgi:hypothetical protein
MSPQTVDEMISNLREMQTEVQDCLRNLETSFSDVDDLHDFFHRQLARVSISSSLFSTSTTLAVRLQLVNWLENFGGRGFSERRRKERGGVSPLNLFLAFFFFFYSIRIIASHLPSG